MQWITLFFFHCITIHFLENRQHNSTVFVTGRSTPNRYKQSNEFIFGVYFLYIGGSIPHCPKPMLQHSKWVESIPNHAQQTHMVKGGDKFCHLARGVGYGQCFGGKMIAYIFQRFSFKSPAGSCLL